MGAEPTVGLTSATPGSVPSAAQRWIPRSMRRPGRVLHAEVVSLRIGLLRVPHLLPDVVRSTHGRHELATEADCL